MIKAYEPKATFGFVNSNSFSIFMLICSIGYALFEISFRDLGDFFQALVMLGSFFLIVNKWQFFRRDPLFWLIPITVVVPILSWVNSLVYIPEHAEKTPKLFDITYFMFFYFIAYWLKGDSKKIFLFWAMSAIGVLFVFIFKSPSFIFELIDGWNGHRVDFSYINANHPAALSGGVVLVLFCFLVSFFYNRTLALSWQTLSVVVALFIFFYIVVITQSRQVFFGLFFSLFVSFIYSYRKNIKQLFLLVFLLVFLFAILLRIPIVFDRVFYESAYLPLFLSNNISEIPFSSTGIRIHFLYESFDWIKSHPIFGLGHDTRSLVIATSSSLPDFIKDDFSHLHNGHIEVLVNYGFLGYGCFLFIFWKVFTAKQSIKQAQFFKSISLSFLLFFIFINFFESFMSFKSGQYLFNCVVAGLYSYQMNKKIKGDNYAT